MSSGIEQLLPFCRLHDRARIALFVLYMYYIYIYNFVLTGIQWSISISAYDRGYDLQAPASGAIKLCRRCNQHKPLTEFYRSKANADGYDGRCKACDAIQCAERRRKKPRVEV